MTETPQKEPVNPVEPVKPVEPVEPVKPVNPVASVERPSQAARSLVKLPQVAFMNNLNIGPRLTVAFGILVMLTLLVAGLSYAASYQATVNINRTDELRVPIVLASARAQANLLRMQADVRGYLALEDQAFRDSYGRVSQDFESNLAELEELKPDLTTENQARINELQLLYWEWAALPEDLFDLRDDQLEREPAYNILATRGSRLAGTVLIDIQEMIDAQALRDPSPDNTALLSDMARFQGTFASMLSGLRGYVTTRNRIFRQEYEVNLVANQFAWDRLNSRRSLLTDSQQEILDNMIVTRAEFLLLPENEIFPVLESDRYREDLYLFSVEALPLADRMEEILNELTLIQQEGLRLDLNTGRQGLSRANRITLIFGSFALLLGIGMSIVFRENIVGPIRRLTGVAELIRKGDLEAESPVESEDEIGILATTFNSMTRQLRQTLLQVRKEKTRADSLLNVVIPIGVDLSFEKNFNRLLEKMLVEAKAFCQANAGTLYLRTEDDHLKYVIVHNDQMDLKQGGLSAQEPTYPPLPIHRPDEDGRDHGDHLLQHVAVHAASMGQSVNVVSARDNKQYDFSGPEAESGYYGESFLAIPLVNSERRVVGVMELVDPRDSETNEIVPFDANLQQMMESFSSLAVAALEAYVREQSLRQEIQQLRIEIDEAKRQQQVSEIVDTDFFSELQAKAREMRRRNRPSE
jgi:CHASE3 domain sensor protein